MKTVELLGKEVIPVLEKYDVQAQVHVGDGVGA
jgi:hypothetical protein